MTEQRTSIGPIAALGDQGGCASHSGLSPRLRGDRSPLWAIEGGARGTAAGEPSKPNRFVWSQPRLAGALAVAAGVASLSIKRNQGPVLLAAR